MRKEYIKLLNDLRVSNQKHIPLHLCVLALSYDYPHDLYKDLKKRLANIDKTDPDLWNKSLAIIKYDANHASYIGSSFWEWDDFETRSTFLERIIKSF